MAPSSPSSHSSSLPSSPMAPSSPTSHAFDVSSPESLPSSPIQKHVDVVASVDEVRRIVKYAELDVPLKFRLAPNMPLAEAHKLWEFVRAEGGGHGELTNPDLLSNKEKALQSVGTRLERLRRWKRRVDRKHDKVLAKVSKLQEAIDAGGPGVPGGYEAHVYDGPAALIDFDQEIAEDELAGHIAAIRALLLERSPGSPATDGDDGTDGSVNDCYEREVKEQHDIAQFNLAYLEVKAKGLQVLREHLLEGIGDLEQRFVYQPTHLGAGDAEFVRFSEIDMYPGEAPKEA